MPEPRYLASTALNAVDMDLVQKARARTGESLYAFVRRAVVKLAESELRKKE